MNMYEWLFEALRPYLIIMIGCLTIAIILLVSIAMDQYKTNKFLREINDKIKKDDK